jgi:hypothetical protein
MVDQPAISSHDPVSVTLEFEQCMVLKPEASARLMFEADELFGFRLSACFERPGHDTVVVALKGLLPYSRVPVPTGAMLQVAVNGPGTVAIFFSFKDEEFYGTSDMATLAEILVDTEDLLSSDAVDEDDIDWEVANMIPFPEDLVDVAQQVKRPH